MAYLLTVSRMDYSARKRKWANPGYAPGVRQFGTPELWLAYPGLLLVVDEGKLEKSVPLLSPKGMLRVDHELIVACYSELRRFSLDLQSSRTFVDRSWCNDLHSLRPSARGFTLAVSGIDAAFELSPSGEEIWSWWAAEHGFDRAIDGRAWSLDKGADHRGNSYPISLQSTHINAVAEVGEDWLAATLLHRNCLVRIDRKGGEVEMVLEGLGRPHAARRVDERHLSLVDTTNGGVLMLDTSGEKWRVVQRLQFETNWIHDAYKTESGWLVADGANSRVIHADDDGNVVRVDNFDPEWCLYEVLPL